MARTNVSGEYRELHTSSTPVESDQVPDTAAESDQVVSSFDVAIVQVDSFARSIYSRRYVGFVLGVCVLLITSIGVARENFIARPPHTSSTLRARFGDYEVAQFRSLEGVSMQHGNIFDRIADRIFHKIEVYVVKEVMDVQEWTVNNDSALMRSGPGDHFEVLKIGPLGAVIVGHRDGEWVKLEGEERKFVGVESNGETILKKHPVTYAVISGGSCEDLGRHPITDRSICKGAAQRLGYNNFGTLHTEDMPTPLGCFLQGNSIRFQSEEIRSMGWSFSGDAHDGGEGDGSMLPICSTRRYEPFSWALVTTTTVTSPSTATNTTTSTSITTATTATATTTTRKDWIHLLCFSVMQPDGAEQSIIQAQLSKSASIFACDDAIVISPRRMMLGTDTNGNAVWTWFNPARHLQMGSNVKGATTSSWLNTEVFQEAYNTIIKSGKIEKNDFLVKADPDAVFFPDRLRVHLKDHKQYMNGLYVINCHNDWGGALYGSLEVYSSKAMMTYKKGVSRCLNLDWHGWGEDFYMQNCMDLLGVQRFEDFKLVGDDRCLGAPCTDGWHVAFHPFKDAGSWLNCWTQSMFANPTTSTTQPPLTTKTAAEKASTSTSRHADDVDDAKETTQSTTTVPTDDDDDEGQDAHSFCCFASSNMHDRCGTCYPGAIAEKGSWCDTDKDKCARCGGGKYIWCTVKVESTGEKIVVS